MDTGHYCFSVDAFPVPLTPGSPGKTRGGDNNVRIRDQVQQVLAAAKPVSRGVERRREKREPFPYPIYLTPVDRDGTILSEKTIVVIGKQLSDLGFDFYYRDPLPYRRVIASFETAQNQWLGIMADLTWCRFGRHGWYDNGGRFVAPVRSPMEDVQQSVTLPG
jgi:hypothetical protein